MQCPESSRPSLAKDTGLVAPMESTGDSAVEPLPPTNSCAVACDESKDQDLPPVKVEEEHQLGEDLSSDDESASSDGEDSDAEYLANAALPDHDTESKSLEKAAPSLQSLLREIYGPRARDACQYLAPYFARFWDVRKWISG